MKKIILSVFAIVLASFSVSFAEEYNLDLEISWGKIQWTSDYIYFKHEIYWENWEKIWMFIPWWDKKVSEEVSWNKVDIKIYNHNESIVKEIEITSWSWNKEETIDKNEGLKEEKDSSKLEKISSQNDVDSWWDNLMIYLWLWALVAVIILVFVFRKKED